jgi:hypothetical protein
MGRPLPGIEAAIVMRRLDDGGLEVLAEPDVDRRELQHALASEIEQLRAIARRLADSGET